MLSEILEDAKEYVKNPQAFSKKKKDKIVSLISDKFVYLCTTVCI